MKPCMKKKLAVLPSLLLALVLAPAAACGQDTVPAPPPPATQPAPPAPADAGADPSVREALALLEGGKLPEAIQVLEKRRQEPAASPQALAFLGALYLEADRPQDALAVLQPIADPPDADPAALYNAGRAAQRLQKPDAAARYWERSVAKAPSSPAARDLGLLLMHQGRVVEAYRLLRPWVIAQPQDGEARLTATALALRLERTAEAEEMLSGFPEGDPAIRLLRAQVLVQKGDGRGALEALKPLQASHPPGMDLELRRTQAEALLLAGDAKVAVALLQGKTQTSPTLALLLGKAQRQAGDAKGALATLKPFMDRLPANPGEVGDPRPAAGVAAEYGRALLAAGDKAGAVTALETATRLYPSGADAWQGLSEALAAAGRSAEAESARGKAEQIRATVQARAASLEAPPAAAPAPQAAAAPEPPMSPAAREVFGLINAGEPAKALTAARQGIALAPKDFALRSFEVRALLMLKRWPEALQAAELTLSAFPGNPDALYQRGVVKMTVQDVAGAEKDLRKAIEMEPRHTAAMNDLAVLLSAQGKKDEAKALLDKVLAINPADPMAADNLKRLREEGTP